MHWHASAHAQLQRPLINNYLSDRLEAKVARAIADAHLIASQVRYACCMCYAYVICILRCMHVIMLRDERLPCGCKSTPSNNAHVLNLCASLIDCRALPKA